MTLYALTPEWQKKAAAVYREDPAFGRAFKEVDGIYAFEIQAAKGFGVETSIYILNDIRKGVLIEDKLTSEDDAKKRASWFLTGSYETWKKVLTGKVLFIQEFMAGNIKLTKGDFAGLMRVAAQGTKLPQIFTKNPSTWPDELSTDELEKYKEQAKKWKEELGI